MVDLTEQEKAAIRAAMKMVAEIMEEIGWETRLTDLTEAQVLNLVEVAVGGFQDAMRSQTTSAITEVPF
jgi:hypothetical protein